MYNFWVFGDSYSTYNRERGKTPLSIYSEVCEYLNVEQKNMAISGLGNQDIFMNLIKYLNDYQSGDTIIFQLSFLDRFSYIDSKNNRTLNEHETLLYSLSKNYFLHPQYYHNGNQSLLTETQIKAFNTFLENNFLNLFDFYFKFFIQLKHIINFLEKNKINFKLVILEDRNIDYNGSSISLLFLLRELMLDSYILWIGDSVSIKSSKYCLEENPGYEYHHFSLNSIAKIGNEIKKKF